MSGIAQHLLGLGHHICGSDKASSEFTAKLQSLGIQLQSESASVEGFDVVVKTSAVKEDHPQIVEAHKLGIPVLLREVVLGCIFDQYPTRIAICGTHGKTTATAMVHHVLERCNIPHTAFVGGSYHGKNYFGGGNIVVAEACEYNASFLHLHPTHTLCLNIEYDHPDCYANLCEVQNAFCQLFEQSKRVILPSSLGALCTKGVFYDDFCAKNLFCTAKCTIFDVFCKDVLVGKCTLPLVGAHNVTNALAVISLCHQLQLSLLQVLHTLATFCGVERRFTQLPYKCKLICDYAHHPTEIFATVQTAKSITKGKVICLFQPHTYTRTKAFWGQFARCFDGVTVIYLPIYPAREKPIDGITSQNLQQFALSVGIDAHYCDSFEGAVQFVEKQITKQDTVLILGAGDVVSVAKMFTK